MSGAVLDAAARELIRRCEAAMALPAKWRRFDISLNPDAKTWRKCADELEAALGTTPPATDAVGPVGWPSEAKHALDGDGWVATSALSEHRMSGDQARVWNGCRAACIAAHKRATPPAGGGDDLSELRYWINADVRESCVAIRDGRAYSVRENLLCIIDNIERRRLASSGGA